MRVLLLDASNGFEEQKRRSALPIKSTINADGVRQVCYLAAPALPRAGPPPQAGWKICWNIKNDSEHLAPNAREKNLTVVYHTSSKGSAGR